MAFPLGSQFRTLYLDSSCSRHMFSYLLADQPGLRVCVYVIVVGIPQDILNLLGTSNASQSILMQIIAVWQEGPSKNLTSHTSRKCLIFFTSTLQFLIYQRFLNWIWMLNFRSDIFLASVKTMTDFSSLSCLLRIVLSPRFIACSKTGTKLFKHFSFASWHGVKLCQQRVLVRIFLPCSCLLGWHLQYTQLLWHPLSFAWLLQYGQLVQYPAASPGPPSDCFVAEWLLQDTYMNSFLWHPSRWTFSKFQRVDYQHVSLAQYHSKFSNSH